MNASPPLADTLPSVQELRFSPGTIIFAQGEPGDAAYLLERGRVSMRQSAYGQVVELDLIQPGEIFGEMAVLDGGNRMASAVAIEECVVVRIAARDFETRLGRADSFLRGLVLKFIKDIRASYRAFLRRPRSLRDHLRQMRAFAGNIRRFAAKIHDDPASPELVAGVDRIEAEIDRLLRVAAQTHDPRHDLILEDEETHGLSVKAVLGSEARRRVSAPAEPPR